jgi:hypothetical protein
MPSLKSFDGYYNDAKISTEQLSEFLSSAAEICGSSSTYHQIQRGKKFNLSHETAVLCYLMSHSEDRFGSLSWLFRPDLLGRYAMKNEHYGVVTQRIAYYLLQLPKHSLLEVLNGSTSKDDILATPIMRLIHQVLREFLWLSPPTPDLYFLVALTFPVMQSIDFNCDACDYLCKASTLLTTLALYKCLSSCA